MSLNLIFHMSNFHNLKTVNNIFFFIFEGGRIFLSIGVYVYVYRARNNTYVVIYFLIEVPMVSFGLVLWQINHCRLFMTNPFLYI